MDNKYVVTRDCRAIIAEELDFRKKNDGIEEIPDALVERAMEGLMLKIERLLDDHQDGLVTDVLDDALAEAEGRS